ncbi:MAG: hypothetical protein HY717_16670 [Planctomycetes bacterium]|nr:hypothetical protein [Planctomycetota bacterium]
MVQRHADFSLPETAGIETTARLWERLPALYRREPGAVRWLVEAVAADLDRFQAVLADRERRGAEEIFQCRFAGARRGAGRGHAVTAGAVREWLRRRTGCRPALWPGLTLREAPPDPKSHLPRLQVSLNGPRPSLAVVWPAAELPDAALPRLREQAAELAAALAEMGLAGMTLQLAKIAGPDSAALPGNPYLHGLIIPGELMPS